MLMLCLLFVCSKSLVFRVKTYLLILPTYLFFVIFFSFFSCNNMLHHCDCTTCLLWKTCCDVYRSLSLRKWHSWFVVSQVENIPPSALWSSPRATRPSPWPCPDWESSGAIATECSRWEGRSWTCERPRTSRYETGPPWQTGVTEGSFSLSSWIIRKCSHFPGSCWNTFLNSPIQWIKLLKVWVKSTNVDFHTVDIEGAKPVLMSYVILCRSWPAVSCFYISRHLFLWK